MSSGSFCMASSHTYGIIRMANLEFTICMGEATSTTNNMETKTVIEYVRHNPTREDSKKKKITLQVLSLESNICNTDWASRLWQKLT